MQEENSHPGGIYGARLAIILGNSDSPIVRCTRLVADVGLLVKKHNAFPITLTDAEQSLPRPLKLLKANNLVCRPLG